EYRISLLKNPFIDEINPLGILQKGILIGLIAGFIASRLMGSGGYGLVGDIIVGLIGAFIGGLLANLLIPDANFGLIGSIIVAIIGACILIALLRLVVRRA